VIEKISGKLASRPRLDKLLAALEPGDAVVVTRLRRIGRNHKHLLELVEWFEKHKVDFVVLEQGIDTTTPLGRLFFRFLAALAEFDREIIVEGTMEGLASARARTGGRPPAISPVQLDQAQRMYDEDKPTMEEIAQAFRVSRSTLYAYLSAVPGDFVMVVYRNTRPGKVDGANRRFGETGARQRVQFDADRKWWNVAPAFQPRLKGVIFVVDGTLARIRSVDPDGTWDRDDRSYADIPLTAPLTKVQIAEQLDWGTLAGDHLGRQGCLGRAPARFTIPWRIRPGRAAHRGVANPPGAPRPGADPRRHLPGRGVLAGVLEDLQDLARQQVGLHHARVCAGAIMDRRTARRCQESGRGVLCGECAWPTAPGRRLPGSHLAPNIRAVGVCARGRR